MNKYQEALNELQQIGASERQNELYAVLQELVDKETPTKPNTLDPCHYECGKCYSTIFPIGCKKTWHKQFNTYCPNCGHKIDWSDEE